MQNKGLNICHLKKFWHGLIFSAIGLKSNALLHLPPPAVSSPAIPYPSPLLPILHRLRHGETYHPSLGRGLGEPSPTMPWRPHLKIRRCIIQAVSKEKSLPPKPGPPFSLPPTTLRQVLARPCWGCRGLQLCIVSASFIRVAFFSCPRKSTYAKFDSRQPTNSSRGKINNTAGRY